jgi:hypothetical protein
VITGVWERLDLAIDRYFRPAEEYRCIRCADTGLDPARANRPCFCETGCYLYALSGKGERS